MRKEWMKARVCVRKENARSGVRTHASEENSTLNYRLRPLGHPCVRQKGKEKRVIGAGGVCERKKEKDKKGASPGIEPGPLAPEANIIPLNYEAVRGKSQEVSDKSREGREGSGEKKGEEKREV